MTENSTKPRPGETPSGLTAHIIIPPSQLLLVPQPRQQDDYYRCTGFLRTRFNDGSSALGTGTIIVADGNYGILTCAHNVYDAATADHLPRYTVFAPALTSGRLSRAAIAVRPPAIRFPADYGGNATGPKDYAVIRLTPDQVPADWGPFPSMQTIPPTQLSTVQVTGYPADPPNPGDPTPAMYHSRGAGSQIDPEFLLYKASTLYGMSGSPVVRVDPRDGGVPDLASITGVHVGNGSRPDGAYNKAVYLSTGVIQWIAGQMA